MKSLSKKSNWLTVVNSTDPKEPTCIHVAGFIGQSFTDDTGKSEIEFRDELTKATGKIRILVNSDGGIIKDGLGIYNAVKERSEDITAEIVGYALSTASWCFLSAGKVLISDNAIVMIHESACGTWGNKRNHRKDGDCLETHDTSIAGMIANRTGKKASDVMKDMEAETWMSGAEALDYGLADEMLSEPENVATPAFNAPWMNRIPTRFTNSASGAKTDPPKGSSKPPITAPDASFTASDQGGANHEQKEQSMDRNSMIALLNKWGVKFDKDASDEVLNKLVEAGKPTNAAPKEPVTTVPGVSLEAFNTEKRKRIRNEVLALAENRIANDKLDWWVNLAMNDEENTIAQIRALPENRAGGEPVGGSIFEGDFATVNGFQGRPTEMVANMYKTNTTAGNSGKTGLAIYDAYKENYPRLLADAVARHGGSVVFNTNTFAAAITTNFLIQGAITQLGPQCASFKAFSRDNTQDPYKPLAVGIQKYNTTVQDGSDTLTSPTDWATVPGDSTLAGPTITPLQYSQLLYLTNAQLQGGVRMADLIEAKLGSFRAKLTAVVTAPITKANFGTTPGTTGAAAPLVSAAGAFGFSDLATLQGNLKKSVVKNVILDGEYIARVSNAPTFFQQAGVVGGMRNAWSAFGWDLLALNTVWPTAENVVGFACNPQAIGIISGLPIDFPEGIPGNVVQTGVAQLAGPDIGVKTYLWFDANLRTLRASYDVILGASAIDKTAGVMIVSS